MSDGLILDNWQKVERLVQKGSIFRGQADSFWGLKPSLTRLLCEAGLNDPNDKGQVARAVRAEEESLRIFQAAHSMPGDLREWIFWWAIAQHYGGATRVLDWSEKVGVAVYFATAHHLDKDGAVFELTRERLLQNEHDPTDILHGVYNTGRGDEGWRKQQQIFRIGEPLALHVCTTSGSPVRMSVQAGFFTSCTNVLQDHEAVLRDRYAGALTKHIIPRESKPQLLREATIRGFSGAALFFDSSEKAGYAQRDEVIRRCGPDSIIA